MTSAHALRVLHARKFYHLALSAAAITPPEKGADPARLMHFRAASAADTAAHDRSFVPPPALCCTAPELLRPRGDAGGAEAASAAADVYSWAMAVLEAWLGASPCAALGTADGALSDDASAAREAALRRLINATAGLPAGVKATLSVRPPSLAVRCCTTGDA